MRKVLLVRHGDTEWDKIGYLSSTDIPLSSAGLKRAEKLAKSIDSGGIEIIVSSPLKRAQQTAIAISKILKIRVKQDNRLREVEFGAFEGMAKNGAKKMFPHEFLKRESDKWNYAPRGGESYKDAGMRLSGLMKSLLESDYKGVVLVTHATLIKVFFILFANVSLGDAEKIFIEPCACFEFVLSDLGKVVSWRKL